MLSNMRDVSRHDFFMNPHSFFDISVLQITRTDDFAQRFESSIDKSGIFDCSYEVILINKRGFFLSVLSEQQDLVIVSNFWV